MSPDLSILIVNYNTKDITLNCLKTVFASKTKFAYEVILVDNDSTDGSVTAITKRYPKVKLIQNTTNDGFAVANNMGAKKAKGKYLWLLNSDTLIQPDTLDKLLNQANKYHAYIATCRLLNRDGSIQLQGGALPNLLNLTTWMLNLDSIPLIAKLIPPYQANRYSHTYGWVGGTAMLVRRDLYLSLDGLDKNIFMYGEDVEFCLRAKYGFISPQYFLEPKLIHLGQQSGSNEKSIIGEFLGLKYIYQKHYSSSQYRYLRVILKVGALLRRIIYALKGDIKRRDTYAKAFSLA